MKKIIFTFITLFTMIPAMAQKKLFTIDDLIPGGKTYRKTSVPENKNLVWWGDKVVEINNDKCTIINCFSDLDNDTAELSDLTLDRINAILTANGLKTIDSFRGVSFPFPRIHNIMLTSGNSKIVVNWKLRTISWSSNIDSEVTNLEWNKITLSSAYVKNHNLYYQNKDGDVTQITQDGGLELTYGESVHRDEFGINKGIFWSPNGMLFAFYRMDQSMVSQYPQVNVTPFENSQTYNAHDSSELKSRCAIVEPDPYPMAGETSHKVSIGVYNTALKKTTYLKTGDPTDRYFTNITWSPDNSKIYLIEVNRDQNHGSLDEYDAMTGEKLRTLFTEDDERYFEPMTPIRFLPWDNSKFVYLSRRDGFNHIYLYNVKSGKLVRQLTSGNFEVNEILGFQSDTKEIIYTSNEKYPIQMNIYCVNMKCKRDILGNSTGWHNPRLSESGNYILDNYSSPIIPRHIDLICTSNRHIANIFSAKNPWAEYAVPEMKTGTIKAADGITDLYYRLILPTDFNPNKKYPAVIYVYGGPHAHNIDASFGWGVRGWDIWMAQKGYVMFCLDNRGSEHRGLAFEQATFRKLGVEEMKDQLKGIDFLKSLPYVDGSRLGIHGWSFGGFMTSSLMTSFSDEETDNPYIFKGKCPFKVGVAGGPVIDWKFYEVMYGERYMDTPQTNPDGYKYTSLLNKAQYLKGRLMVIYGLNDPTCVPQHTLSFMRACINANTYPDLFTYPGDGHNMSGSDRIHLHNTITRYFEDHLK